MNALVRGPGPQQKVDYRKVHAEVYRASAKAPALLEVPPMQFLMVDGAGDPEGSALFEASVGALFALAYAIKFALKKGPMALDFAVMPLEGLWWADDMAHFMAARDRWRWTLMVMQPPVVDAALVEAARRDVARKKGPGRLEAVRLERFDEGRAAQLLHVGPFAEEGPSVQRLHRFIADQGLALRGRHHEIYLSDIRRSPPHQWRTVLRQPVAPAGGPPTVT